VLLGSGVDPVGTFRLGIDQLCDGFEALDGGFVPAEPPG